MIGDKLGFPQENEEQFRHHCLAVLEKAGITDRRGLLKKGSAWFQKQDFKPFHGWKDLANAILNTNPAQINHAMLDEIADKLGLPQITELPEKVNKAKQEPPSRKLILSILSEKNIKDRLSLRLKGPAWLQKEDFIPIGKGKAFARAVLGKTIRIISTETLEEISDKLDFPEISVEQLKARYLTTLTEKGITGRPDLIKKGPVWFANEDFPPFGKGRAFAGAILGRTIYMSTLAVLEEICDFLGYSSTGHTRVDRQIQKGYLTILREKGIVCRARLLALGPEWFAREDFFPFGNGASFASAVMGRPIFAIRVDHKRFGFLSADVLEEIADKIGLP